MKVLKITMFFVRLGLQKGYFQILLKQTCLISIVLGKVWSSETLFQKYNETNEQTDRIIQDDRESVDFESDITC